MLAAGQVDTLKRVDSANSLGRPVDSRQETNQGKQRVFPVKLSNDRTGNTPAHATLQLELRNHGVERSRQP